MPYSCTIEKRMSAGYSKRSLAEKLGIKEGMRTLLLNEPKGYEGTLSVAAKKKIDGLFDFMQFFTADKSELEKNFPKLKKALAQAGMLWISWPKGSSKVATDLNENIVREIGLKNGLVDVKVCAVDETWSGLKFVYRTRDRK